MGRGFAADDARKELVRSNDVIPRGLRKRLAKMFDDEDAAPPGGQPFSSEEALFTAAERAFESYRQVLDMGKGASEDLGARAYLPDSPEAAAQMTRTILANPDVPHVIVAPLKGRERARQKVAKKLGGDWSRLADVVRGTILVPSVEDLPAAVESIKKNAAKNGWKVRDATNRFVEDGGPVNTGPLSTGYRDVSMVLESPDGIQTEVQVNTVAFWEAKEGEGHKLYEIARPIIERARHEKRDLTPNEYRVVRDSEKRSRALYGPAFRRSLARGKAAPHRLYFETPEGTRLVPLSRLRPSKPPETQPRSVENARRLMRAAAAGKGDRRGPITVEELPDGNYRIVDGNATFGAAPSLGLRALPVRIRKKR